MKNLGMLAVALAAVAATVVTEGCGDSPKNQAGATSKTNAPASSAGNALNEPVKSVLEHYIKIQSALADDSTNGMVTNAAAISDAIKADKAKTLPADVATAADELAKAKDIGAARGSFKDLSDGLIKYLSDQKVQTGRFQEVYCPMATASWLQTNQDVANPYLGQSMPGCGEPKRTF